MLLIGRGREPQIFHVIFIPDKIGKAGRGISFRLDTTRITYVDNGQITGGCNIPYREEAIHAEGETNTILYENFPKNKN